MTQVRSGRASSRGAPRRFLPALAAARTRTADGDGGCLKGDGLDLERDFAWDAVRKWRTDAGVSPLRPRHSAGAAAVDRGGLCLDDELLQRGSAEGPCAGPYLGSVVDQLQPRAPAGPAPNAVAPRRHRHSLPSVGDLPHQQVPLFAAAAALAGGEASPPPPPLGCQAAAAAAEGDAAAEVQELTERMRQLEALVAEAREARDSEARRAQSLQETLAREVDTGPVHGALEGIPRLGPGFGASTQQQQPAVQEALTRARREGDELAQELADCRRELEETSEIQLSTLRQSLATRYVENAELKHRIASLLSDSAEAESERWLR
eukprot:TRINITY_DN727_c1_g3_i1.p1 TRINITY_DN727_c1_g3~~TRINITY_DN727_c1_g3_i1.p1  ORF type:complete len:321 (+),score=73.30 TRINITY_DN727_c1_g3_i1:193-1155(+)